MFPEFLTRCSSDYKILNNKFHIAGVSNGGLSAFHIAASYPQYFWSVTGFPGYLPDATPTRVRALPRCASICTSESWTPIGSQERAQAANSGRKGSPCSSAWKKAKGT